MQAVVNAIVYVLCAGCAWHLNCQDVRNLEIPVPPLEEQKRFVAKVEKLMGLCDHYEAGKQTRDNRQQKLRESTMASLMNAETDEELDAAWAFVRNISPIQRQNKTGARELSLESPFPIWF